MGNIIPSPIIIEFYGLPGAGKTTVSRRLQQRSLEMGLASVTMYYRNIFHRKSQSLLFAPRYWKIIKASSSYAKLLSKRCKAFRILSMIRFVRMYRHFVSDKPADCLVVEQGFFQAMISIANFERLPESDKLTNLLELIDLNSLPLLLVKCNVSDETANERVLSRPLKGKGCRVEKLTDEERIKAFLVQSYNFSFLRENMNRLYCSVDEVEIDTEKPVESNVDIILNHILQQK